MKYFLIIACVPVRFYLTHLSMKGDSCDAQVPEHQRHPLGVVTGAAEDHEGVSRQLIEDGHQVAILQQSRKFSSKYVHQKLKRTSWDSTDLVLGWYEDVVLLQLVYRGVLCRYCTFDRIFQSSSLKFLHL